MFARTIRIAEQMERGFGVSRSNNSGGKMRRIGGRWLLDRIRAIGSLLSPKVSALARKPRYWIGRKERYHLIDTKLPPRYHDFDALMLHGMMELLVRYVECEMIDQGAGAVPENKPLLSADDPADYQFDWRRRRQAAQKEAFDIYRWWTSERQKEWAAYHKEAERRDAEDRQIADFRTGGCVRKTMETMDVYVREILFQIETTLHARDQEMLHRLIDIRRSLCI